MATEKHNAVDELDMEALLKEVRKQAEEVTRSDFPRFVDFPESFH